MALGHRELVRLKMTPHDVNNFNPPQGVDIDWIDYDYYQGEVTASITGLEWAAPDDTYLVYKEEINSMLSDLKVAQDGIRSSKYPLKFVRTIDTCRNFIENTPHDNLISKGKENIEILDAEKARYLINQGAKVEPFYDSNDRKAYKLQTVGFTV